MIITFKSRATADTIMFGDVAKDLLSLMGKAFEPRGIITLEQLPDAIARLRQAGAVPGPAPGTVRRHRPPGQT